MLEPTSIRYFREVTASGSIKVAAASLRIAPSAISRQIQSIEQDLSIKLFERSVRGMELTNAGRLVHRYAIENRERLDEIRAAVQEYNAVSRGQVSLATVEGMLAHFLSNFIVELSSSFPGIYMSIKAMGSRDVAETVGSKNVDLGIVFGRAPRGDLIELARLRQPLCLIVSPRHHLATRSECSMKELDGLHVVAPDSSFGIRQEIDRACAHAKVTLEICNETNSLAFAQTLASNTGLATFLPQDTAMPGIKSGLLAAVPIRDKRLEMTQVTLVRSATRKMPPSARLVADILIQRMRAQQKGLRA